MAVTEGRREASIDGENKGVEDQSSSDLRPCKMTPLPAEMRRSQDSGPGWNVLGGSIGANCH